MRNLNSLLLEGNLIDSPVLVPSSDVESPARCAFSLASDPDPASVPVVVYGRLAEYCLRHLSEGSAIRVVGRIAQDAEATAATGTFRLCVIAEHIEIKPSSSRRLPTEEAANVF